MKTKSLIHTLLGMTLSIAALSSMAANLNLLGDAAPDAAANRTINITPDTKYVNVQSGQTVEFASGGKTFAWNFDGPGMTFNLNRIAPPGMLDHMVQAYVAPDPIYTR